MIWSVRQADLSTFKTEVIFESHSALQLLGWSVSGHEVIVGTAESRSRIPTRAGAVSLIRVSAEGKGNQPIGHLKAALLTNIQLSPDRRIIAFSSRQDGEDNIWLISTGRDEARKITSNTDPTLYFSSMAFSPDGKTIYFGKESRASSMSVVDNFH